MNVTLSKTKLNGKLRILGSKSFAHRQILGAFLTNNQCEIDNVPNSKDVDATLSCIKSMGGDFVEKDGKISIISVNSCSYDKEIVLNCGESGSTLRFIIPIALTRFSKIKVVGTKKLISRGIEEYESIFKKQNISYKIDEESIEICGRLTSGCFEINGSKSSQYITGLLFALPLLEGDSIIKILPPINSKNYIDISLSVLRDFNINFRVDGNDIYLQGNQKYNQSNFAVEGDYSNAAFLEAFNYFGSSVSLEGLNENSLQGDRVYKELFSLLNQSNQVIDVSNCIDLCPVLFVFASLKYGGTFKGTSRLKFKESDRASVLKEELAKIGSQIIIEDDAVIVEKANEIGKYVVFDTHNDHRIAMALSLVSVFTEVKLNNAECIEKSYPNYFGDLASLGGTVTYEK